MSTEPAGIPRRRHHELSRSGLSAGSYLTAYRDAVAQAWASVDPAAFDHAAALLAAAIRSRRVMRTMAAPGDVLITISSSGNSENIVRAIDWARANGVGSIAMTGFTGGRSAVRADVSLHVAAENYGVVEDVHQSMMHCLAQYLRQSAMPPELVAHRVF